MFVVLERISRLFVTMYHTWLRVRLSRKWKYYLRLDKLFMFFYLKS